MPRKGNHNTARETRLADPSVAGEPSAYGTREKPGHKVALPTPRPVNVWGRPFPRKKNTYNRGAF